MWTTLERIGNEKRHIYNKSELTQRENSNETRQIYWKWNEWHKNCNYWNVMNGNIRGLRIGWPMGDLPCYVYHTHCTIVKLPRSSCQSCSCTFIFHHRQFRLMCFKTGFIQTILQGSFTAHWQSIYTGLMMNLGAENTYLLRYWLAWLNEFHCHIPVCATWPCTSLI